MLFFKRQSKQTQSRGFSMFDIPLDAYHPVTQLPSRVVVGGQVIQPLVEIQDLKDYLTLMGAFHEVQSLRDFGKIAEQGAMQYQIWAQMMLPYYFERRVERSKGIRPRYQRSMGGEFMHRIDTVLDSDRYPNGPEEPIMGGVITSSPTIYDGMESWPRSGSEDDHTDGGGEGKEESSDTLARTARSEIGTNEETKRANTTTEPSLIEDTRMTRSTTATTDTDATLIDDEVQEDGIQFLPPLPVLMAWHAHILHSAKYEKEVGPDGAYAALRDYPFPLREAAQAIRDGTLPEELEVYGPYTSRRLETTIMDPLDISSAMVHHNAKFVDKLYHGNWLDGGLFEKEVYPLQRSILRYHGWLDMVHSVGDSSCLVSTLDIDLVWRIHRLDPFRYLDQTESLTGVTLGEPKGDRYTPEIARRTSKLWKQKFGTSYQ